MIHGGFVSHLVLCVYNQVAAFLLVLARNEALTIPVEAIVRKIGRTGREFHSPTMVETTF